jgi:hypothetical protein
MKIDPALSPEQVKALSREILLCQRLLRKLWADDSRRDVFARRRSCYRILYDIPLGMPVPIDWEPAPHPQTSR